MTTFWNSNNPNTPAGSLHLHLRKKITSIKTPPSREVLWVTKAITVKGTARETDRSSSRRKPPSSLSQHGVTSYIAGEQTTNQ